MVEKDKIKVVIDEIYSNPPKENYPTNEIVSNHIDEKWSIDLMDMSDYKISNKGFKYIFIIIDKFSKYTWCAPSRDNFGETIKNEFSKILSTSKRKPIKIESGRGKDFYISVFQNLLKVNNIHHSSSYCDKGPSIAERVLRTSRNLLKKPVFGKRKANWIIELPSVTKSYNNTIHHSIEMTLIEASRKMNENTVFSTTKFTLDENNL